MMDRIDNELKEYMMHAEKKCHRIKSGQIPFSPESEVWIHCRQTYTKLSRFARSNVNCGNLLNAAQNYEPIAIIQKKLLMHFKVCNKHCDFQRYHLLKRADIARESGNEDGMPQILYVITRV